MKQRTGIPPGAPRRPTLANASSVRSVPRDPTAFLVPSRRLRWRSVPASPLTSFRSLRSLQSFVDSPTFANAFGVRSVPRDAEASLDPRKRLRRLLSPGVHASGASVGSGDERSESPGESATSRLLSRDRRIAPLSPLSSQARNSGSYDHFWKNFQIVSWGSYCRSYISEPMVAQVGATWPHSDYCKSFRYRPHDGVRSHRETVAVTTIKGL